jgi:hypothetical protein
MVVGKALPAPCRRSSTYFTASLKYRYGISRVMEYMSSGQSTTPGADDGD